MSKFAAGTELPLSRSIDDIEKLVRGRGYGGFVQGIADDRIVIAFASEQGRQVRFIVPVREQGADLLSYMKGISAAARTRQPTTASEAWDQHRRQLGRALLLTIKAKIECIDLGIETFEDAFMSQLTLPDKRTAGAMVKQEVEQLYSGGAIPPRLLPASDQAA